MSIDFPNRSDWLAVRATPRKLSGRYVWNKGTFFAGRNDDKRDANRSERTKRAAAVAIHRDEGFSGRAPKRTYGLLRVDVLSDRRVRQRANAL